MNADEDLVRVYNCKRRDDTKFGLPPGTTHPRRLSDSVTANLNNNHCSGFVMVTLVGKDTLFVFLAHQERTILHFMTLDQC